MTRSRNKATTLLVNKGDVDDRRSDDEDGELVVNNVLDVDNDATISTFSFLSMYDLEMISVTCKTWNTVVKLDVVKRNQIELDNIRWSKLVNGQIKPQNLHTLVLPSGKLKAC